MLRALTAFGRRTVTMAGQTRWSKLNWQDPFELDEQLSEEQRMVRDSARGYA